MANTDQPRELSGVSCRVTPPGFDVTTASPEELALYRIPPRPDPDNAPEQFASWNNAFKKDFKLIEPELRVSSRFHGPVQGYNQAAAQTTNWAGAVLANFLPLTFIMVAAQWQVQWIWPGSDPFPQILVTWIGMDGLDNADVLQAGVSQEFDSAVENTYLWWEWVPNASVDITNLPVSPGDTISCIVSFGGLAFGPGPTEGIVVFSVNGTTGVSIGIPVPGNATFFGSTAEFIAERPAYSLAPNSPLYALPEYASVTFSQISANLSDGTVLNLTPNLANNDPILLTMVDDNGTIRSEPSVASPTTLLVFPPAPVKTFEKGHREKNNGEKGHHVIENIPVRAPTREAATPSSGSRQTFIAKRERPLEGK